MLYTLIFMSTIFITNSLYSMEIQTKKQYPKPIIQEFILTQKICTKHTIPQDVIHLIKQYSMLLKKKHFEQTFPYTDLWDDFRIPTSYQYLLASLHINILATLFEYPPTEYQIARGQHGQPIMRYSLSSKKDYKLFLTLPIEIRKCLTKLPQSKIKLYPECAHYNINENNTIYLEAPNKYSKEKLIILEKEIHSREQKKILTKLASCQTKHLRDFL